MDLEALGWTNDGTEALLTPILEGFDTFEDGVVVGLGEPAIIDDLSCGGVDDVGGGLGEDEPPGWGCFCPKTDGWDLGGIGADDPVWAGRGDIYPGWRVLGVIGCPIGNPWGGCCGGPDMLCAGGGWFKAPLLCWSMYQLLPELWLFHLKKKKLHK